MLDYKISKLAVLLLLFAGARVASCVADDRVHSQQFFNTYCVSCHGQKKPKADIRLDQIDVQQWNDPSLLDDIYSAIESGAMPPEDAPEHPEPGQSKAMQKVLGNQLHVLAEKQKPGMLKRLSRVEYQNTVNDVFGTDFTLIDRLPLDNINAGFDNNADNLHMSAVDMETYFNVANRIAESVVSDKPVPRVVVYSTKNTDIDTHSHKDDTKAFAPSLERQFAPAGFCISRHPNKNQSVGQNEWCLSDCSTWILYQGQVCSRQPQGRKIACRYGHLRKRYRRFAIRRPLDELLPSEERWSRTKHCYCDSQKCCLARI